MIDGDIKNACENSKMICIGLRNDPADDYLVGYVECCDEEGIIFCNVDYRLIKTGYIYMTNDKVTGVLSNDDYIQKLKILMNNKKSANKLSNLATVSGLEISPASSKACNERPSKNSELGITRAFTSGESKI